MSLALLVDSLVTIVLCGGLSLGSLAFVVALPWRADEVREAERGVRLLRERVARSRAGRPGVLARLAAAA